MLFKCLCSFKSAPNLPNKLTNQTSPTYILFPIIHNNQYTVYHWASFLAKKPFKTAINFSNAANQTLNSLATFSGSSPSLT